MFSVTPNAVEVNAAFNLLTVLEIIKDPSALKANLEQLKQAQDAIAAEREAAEKAKGEADSAAANAASAKAALAAKEAALAEQVNTARRRTEEADAVTAASKVERARFDDWMAAEREKLDAQVAAVNARAAENQKQVQELAKAHEDLIAKANDLNRLEAAAEAKKAEYESKLASLKAMVSE